MEQDELSRQQWQTPSLHTSCGLIVTFRAQRKSTALALKFLIRSCFTGDGIVSVITTQDEETTERGSRTTLTLRQSTLVQVITNALLWEFSSFHTFCLEAMHTKSIRGRHKLSNVVVLPAGISGSSFSILGSDSRRFPQCEHLTPGHVQYDFLDSNLYNAFLSFSVHPRPVRHLEGGIQHQSHGPEHFDRNEESSFVI